MKLLSRILTVLLFLAIAAPAYAMTTRGGQTVTVPTGETVVGTLFAGGNSIAIDGTVNGDLFCGGQNVTIGGTVNGDVICGAQTIDVTGTVSGSLRTAAQMVDVNGTVKRNVTVAAQTLTLGKTATVAGEVIFAGANLTNSGRVVGPVTHWQPKEEKVKPERIIVKKTVQQEVVSLLIKMIIFGVLAAIVMAVAPKQTDKVLKIMREKPWHSMGVGFFIMLIVPTLILTMVITIIGIPLAVLAGLAFGLAIAISRVFVAILAGQYVLNNFHVNRAGNTLLPVFVGVPLTVLVFAVPVIGWLLSFLAVLWGLGAMWKSRKAK